MYVFARMMNLICPEIADDIPAKMARMRRRSNAEKQHEQFEVAPPQSRNRPS